MNAIKSVTQYAEAILKPRRSQFRMNFLAGIIFSVLGSAISIISYPLYLHFLGYDLFGTWVILSTIQSCAQLGNLGISTAVTAIVAREMALGSPMGVQRVVSTAILTLIGTGSVVALMIIVLRSQLVALFHLTGKSAYWMEALIPIMAVFGIYIFVVECLSATVTGLGRMDVSALNQVLAQLVAFIMGAIFLWRGQGVIALLLGAIASYVVLHALTVKALRSALHSGVFSFRSFNWRTVSELVSFGAWLSVGSLVALLLAPFSKLMLARAGGPAFVSCYEIAYNSAMRIRSLIEAGFRAIVPEVSKLNADSAAAGGQLRRVNRRAIMVALCTGLPLYVGLFVLATPVVHIWLGKGARPDLVPSLRIMLLASFASLTCVPAYYILLGVGRTGTCSVASAMQAAVNAACLLAIASIHDVTPVTASWGALVAMLSANVFLLSNLTYYMRTKYPRMRQGRVEVLVKQA